MHHKAALRKQLHRLLPLHQGHPPVARNRLLNQQIINHHKKEPANGNMRTIREVERSAINQIGKENKIGLMNLDLLTPDGHNKET